MVCLEIITLRVKGKTKRIDNLPTHKGRRGNGRRSFWGRGALRVKKKRLGSTPCRRFWGIPALAKSMEDKEIISRERLEAKQHLFADTENQKKRQRFLPSKMRTVNKRSINR